MRPGQAEYSVVYVMKIKRLLSLRPMHDERLITIDYDGKSKRTRK